MFTKTRKLFPKRGNIKYYPQTNLLEFFFNQGKRMVWYSLWRIISRLPKGTVFHIVVLGNLYQNHLWCFLNVEFQTLFPNQTQEINIGWCPYMVPKHSWWHVCISKSEQHCLGEEKKDGLASSPVSIIFTLIVILSLSFSLCLSTCFPTTCRSWNQDELKA